MSTSLPKSNPDGTLRTTAAARPQKCSCPPCRVETGMCNPHTKNMEVRRICFRLRPDGQCEPLTIRQFRPCGEVLHPFSRLPPTECPPTLQRIPGQCDYCKGERLVHLKTFFREEGGQFRCRLVDNVHPEPCSCKPIKLVKHACEKDNTPMRIIYVQEQKSCLDCEARKKVILDRPVVCRRRWIRRGPCHRSDNHSPAVRKVIHMKQVVKDCRCRLAMRVTTEVCDCPAPTRSNPECVPHLNQLAIKWTVFHPDRQHCVGKTKVTLLPRPPCCPKPQKTLSPCHNGMQVERHIIYDLVEGTCRKHVNERKVHCKCAAYGIRRITECNIKRPGDTRRYRHLLTTSPRIEECMCHEPASDVQFEACDCPEANEPPVKQVQQCPQWCYHTTSEQCDARCCPRNHKILERSCTTSGHEQVTRISETVLRQGRCVHVIRQVRERVPCAVGFLRHEWARSNEHGVRLLRDLFGNVDRCKCSVQAVDTPCPKVCREAIKSTECDVGTQELVHTLIQLVPIGCRCEEMAFKRRTSVLCPKFTKLISAKCSPITNVETRKYLHSYQDNCQCKNRVVTEQRRCGCPKPRLSDLTCDPQTNRLRGIRTVYELDGSDCAVRKELVQKPIDCRQHHLLEPRQNDGRPVLHFSCDEQTGQGRLWITVWVPHQCRCVRRRHVIREGACRCPPPQTAMHCDTQTNNWIRKTTQFVLDRQHLQCRRRQADYHARPTSCKPKMRITRGPCVLGRMMETLTEQHRDPNGCACLERIRKVMRDCRCPTEIVGDGQCDGQRESWEEVILERRWDPIKQTCVIEKRTPSIHFCKCPTAQTHQECKNGVIEQTHVAFKLNPRMAVCERVVHQRRFKPHCEYPPALTRQTPHSSLFHRYRQSPCDPATCTLKLEVFVRKYDPSQCLCRWRLAESRRCTCCGCPKPQLNVKCINDKNLIGTITYYATERERCGHKCVPKTQDVYKEVDCNSYPRPPKAHWTTCDRATCLKHYRLPYYERRNCKCVLTEKTLASRPCWCPDKPTVRAVCVGNCAVSVREVYRFDRDNQRCVKENYIQRQCRKCPKPHELREPCDVSGSCMQTVRLIHYIVEDCHCKRLEQVRQERCCCPAPVTLGSKCLEDVGVVETKQVSYDLVNGHCAERVQLNRIPTTCPPAGSVIPEPVAPCNPQTCLRPVLGPRWIRVGCQCVEQKPQRFETCCCTNRILTQAWKLHHGECVKVMVSKGLQSPPCLPQKITPLGPCNPETKTQPALLERFVVKNCKCQSIGNQEIKRVCACPAPEDTVGQCDPVTCLQRVHRVAWMLEPHDNHCRRLAPQVLTRPCCCSREQHKPVDKVRCIPETGQLEIVRISYRFDPRSETCEPHTERHFKMPDCPNHGKLLRGKCDQTRRWTIDRVVLWRPHAPTCRCRVLTKLLKRPCDCSYLDHEPRKPICIADEGLLLKKRIIHQERHGTCQPEERWLKKKIVCQDGVNMKVNCNPQTCQGEQISTWFERVGCSCVPRERKTQGKCCCPSPREEHRCLDDGKLAVLDKISYRLDPVRMECVQQVDRVRRDVECSEGTPHVLRRYCDRETCHPVSLLRRIVRRNCQCGNLVRRVVHRNHQCCCPPPRFTEKCYEMYGVLSRVVYKYELFRGHCVTRKIVDQDQIGCPPPRLIKENCGPGMLFRKVVRVWFELEGNPVDGRVQCRERSMHLYTEPCKIKNLMPNLADELEHFNYTLVNRCNQFGKHSPLNRELLIVKQFDEMKAIRKRNDTALKCPPPSVTKHCNRGELVFVRREHRMSMHTGHPACQLKTFVKKVPVMCDQQSTRHYRSACWNHQRKVVRIRQRLDPSTCECRSMAKVDFEACDCHLKNKEKSECQNGVLRVYATRYSSRPGLNRCVKTTTRSIHPVVCSGQTEVIQSSGCTIEQPNGVYRSEEIRWRQVTNCQCVTQRKQVLRLCGCPQPQEERRCLDTVNLAVYKTTFNHVADQCIPNQEVVTTEIRCIRPARIVDKTSCEHGLPLDQNPAGCMEQITVAFDQVENCQCITRTLKFRRPCCVPEPRTERHCDASRSRWVTTRTTYKLSPAKVLFESGDLTIWDQVPKAIHHAKEQVVTCPEDQIRETCDPQTGMWTQTVTHYERVGCHCKRTVKINHGQCRCPPARVTETPCQESFLQRITETFELIEGRCVGRRHIERIRCACPRPIRRIYCDGTGRWIKCFAQFLFNPVAKVCRLVKNCVRWEQDCPKPANRLVGPCGPQTGFTQAVQHVRFVRDQRSCRCQPEVLSEWKEHCRCDHINRMSERCHDGMVEVRGIVHELVNGECKPKQVKHTKPIVCPAPNVRIVPCNRSPTSALRGLSLKIVDAFERHGCQCVRRRHVYKKICGKFVMKSLR
ncbi:unnamed protein product [Echinostoma caproni]|uniref:VWFA domain-containing protein n=1 Tax=Echinostoma caproni TaxID=27848 RepID=A0A183A713_9TREM|nr:unnamed protein product [Echinostoma caproni]